MPYESSDYSFKDGVQGRYLLWGFPVVPETYPAIPDDLWRLVKYGSLNISKTADLGTTRQLFLQVIREGLGPTAHNVWMRHMNSGELTNQTTFLLEPEYWTPNNIYTIFSTYLIGDGILMPPRAQLRASINDAASFSCSADLFILEAPKIDLLKPYM